MVFDVVFESANYMLYPSRHSFTIDSVRTRTCVRENGFLLQATCRAPSSSMFVVGLLPKLLVAFHLLLRPLTATTLREFLRMRAFRSQYRRVPSRRSSCASYFPAPRVLSPLFRLVLLSVLYVFPPKFEVMCVERLPFSSATWLLPLDASHKLPMHLRRLAVVWFSHYTGILITNAYRHKKQWSG